MSLVADYSSSSEGDGTSRDSSPKSHSNYKVEGKLPSASVLLGEASTLKPGKVFSNVYIQEEQAHIALLEQHVKMVDPDDSFKEKTEKKVCWNHRKGRCKFGSRCSFAHIPDVTTTEQTHIISQESASGTRNAEPLSDNNVPIKKKRRPGLSNSLIPSKRVLKEYSEHSRLKSNHKMNLT